MEKIWEAQLDNRYDCQVIRINEAHGLLTIIDTENQTTLLSDEVTLAYGARFGPDVDDVTDWQERCVQAVDGLSRTQ